LGALAEPINEEEGEDAAGNRARQAQAAYIEEVEVKAARQPMAGKETYDGGKDVENEPPKAAILPEVKEGSD
jgi:hypothetical protein